MIDGKKTALTRREVLATGAAAAMAAVSPAFAQTAAVGGQPVVLITGTSSGFGRMMTETFARNGLRVIATMRDIGGRNAPAAEELRALALADKLPIDVVEIDVIDEASVERGVAEALRLAGRVDVLVNNAAITVPAPVELLPTRVYDANFETNVNGSLRVFRALSPQMRERGQGYLIQISSALGRMVMAGSGSYCASKAAIEAACDTIAIENAAFGLDVTIVQPAGPYPTRFQENGRRYLEEMLAALPESDRPRLAAFDEQVAAVRRDYGGGDPNLDSQEIADGVLGLISTAPGERPLRLVIGPGHDLVNSINQAHDQVQAAIR